MAELADGADLEADLIAAADDMPILGPNCYGMINGLDRLAVWPDQHGVVPVDRGVAIVTQSSNIAINLTMQRRGLPVAYVVTAGNQAQTDLAEIGRAVLADDRVTALGLYIEGIRDLSALEVLADEAWTLGKPIVALKVGASDHAQGATVSHTGSIAGSDAGARAVLARLGIAQVGSLAAMLEALKIAHVTGRLDSREIASMSCSGGEASLMADLADGAGLSFPLLETAQRSALETALGPKGALSNPLDYHTYIWGDLDAMTATFTAMMTPDHALGIVVLDFPRADRCDDGEWHKVIAAVEATAASTGRPMAILASIGEGLSEEIAQDLMARGIIPLVGMADALAAVAAMGGVSEPSAGPLFLRDLPSVMRTLSEAEGKAMLAGAGVSVPAGRRAGSAAEAGQVAQTLTAPLVLKGEGLAHKSEAGAVALSLAAGDVADAADRMATESFLIEEMIVGGIAELLIGVVRDPAHGYVLTLGAGGVLTEIMGDAVSLSVPATRDDVAHALSRLKIAPVLEGYRGKPGVDMGAVIDAVMAVQKLLQTEPIFEIEINPLICGANFATAADALIVIGET